MLAWQKLDCHTDCISKWSALQNKHLLESGCCVVTSLDLLLNKSASLWLKTCSLLSTGPCRVPHCASSLRPGVPMDRAGGTLVTGAMTLRRHTVIRQNLWSALLWARQPTDTRDRGTCRPQLTIHSYSAPLMLAGQRCYPIFLRKLRLRAKFRGSSKSSWLGNCKQGKMWTWAFWLHPALLCRETACALK